MSFKTLERDADWSATVRISQKETREIYLTNEEYQKYRVSDANNLRSLHLKDGSIALSSIVLVEPIIRSTEIVSEDHQVESPDPLREKSHDELKHQAILSDNLRARLEQKGVLKPKKMKTNLSTTEFEKKREELLDQGRQLQHAD